MWLFKLSSSHFMHGVFLSFELKCAQHAPIGDKIQSLFSKVPTKRLSYVQKQLHLENIDSIIIFAP